MTEQSFTISRFVPFAIIAAWFIYYMIYAPFFLGMTALEVIGDGTIMGGKAFLLAAGWWYGNHYIEQKRQEEADKNKNP